MNRSTGIGQIVAGVLLAAGSVWLFLWARYHSPHLGFFEALQKLNQQVLTEGAYNAIVAVSVVDETVSRSECGALLGVLFVPLGLAKALRNGGA